MYEKPLHVVDRALPDQSGYTLRTHHLAKAQTRAGMSPEIMVRPCRRLFPCQQVTRDGVAVQIIEGVRYHRLSERRRIMRNWIYVTQKMRARGIPGSWRFGRTFRVPAGGNEMLAERLANRVPATVIHAHTPNSNAAAAAVLSSKLGVPLVWEVRGFWEMSAESQSRDLVGGVSAEEWERRETAAAKSADLVVTLGHAMRDELIRRGVPGHKIRVVPNGVDVDAFKPAGARDQRLCDALRLNGCFVIGYVTNVRKLEGIDTVLRSLSLLRGSNANVVFVLVGGGSDLARLQSIVEREQLGRQVRFVGEVPHSEVSRYYSLFDAFVVPRTADQVCRIVTPLKPLEAMAMGIPTIVSDIPALREIIRPGITGDCFPPGDSAELANVIRRLAGSPELRNEMGRRGLTAVREERSWSAIASLTRQVYDEARDCMARRASTMKCRIVIDQLN